VFGRIPWVVLAQWTVLIVFLVVYGASELARGFKHVLVITSAADLPLADFAFIILIQFSRRAHMGTLEVLTVNRFFIGNILERVIF
jgi:hypothetical protein